MARGVGAEELYSAIEKSAQLADTPCAREKVLPILRAYEDAFVVDGGIVFSVQTGGQESRDLEYTIQLSASGDPYERALSGGFVTRTDHPVGALLTDLRDRVSIDLFAVDGGVVGGFKKLYAVFPRDLRNVSSLAEIPSMPRSLAEHSEYFSRYGLEESAVIGVDYRRRTMNVYFQLPVPGALEARSVRSMLDEIGIPEPDERMVEYACRSYRVYATLSWDLPGIQRISFAPAPRRGLDLSGLPTRPEPEIERFMNEAPYTYEGDPIRTSVVKWSADSERLDLGSYYQMSPLQLKAVMASQQAPA
ncbi:aromatic prenyltransferase [Streptomyces sp. B93]|uniref:aromatic prenyltransferase n=1 Tax=Streptomyces sp. B93 TaxID=2824875 RepID=UPI001B36BDBA|nr:aromatic prenyltransferase [Streptomyces sp. B93]MBQ1093506.1 hypothetical protein [Streptomyces sp. B93]